MEQKEDSPNQSRVIEYIAGKHALAVSVGHISELGEELLIGSSFINRDENDSIVRATLDAINRRVMRYYVK